MIDDAGVEGLARFLHDTYEAEAPKQGWSTQESCRTGFDDLPPENKALMLAVARRVHSEYITTAQRTIEELRVGLAKAHVGLSEWREWHGQITQASGSDQNSRGAVLARVRTLRRELSQARKLADQNFTQAMENGQSYHQMRRERDEAREERDRFANLWTDSTEAIDRWDDKCSALRTQVADLTERLEMAEKEVVSLWDAASNVHGLPGGFWTVSTSNSFRRISSADGDGDVLRATKHPDGWPDLSWNEAQCQYLCNLVNGLRAALRGEGDKPGASTTAVDDQFRSEP